MFYGKLRATIDKLQITNIVKIAALLLFLFIIYRLLTPSLETNQGKNIHDIHNIHNIEGFETLGYSNYGNQLTLQEPTNTPKYAGNTCAFKLDGVYRLEALNLVFNSNPNESTLDNKAKPFAPSDISKIYIQYEDGNGNLRYIKSSITSSPPNFHNSSDLTNNERSYVINVSRITDENNLAVFTSKIIVSVGDNNNNIDRYIDNTGNGYFSSFAFWGSTRDMLSKADFENLAPSLSLKSFASNNITYDNTTNTDTFIFSTVSDTMLYGISIDYKKTEIINPGTNPTIARNSNTPKLDTTDSPFKLNIQYNNGVYAGNNFTINAKYIIRSDANMDLTEYPTAFIIFSQPIIANKLVINIPRVRSLVSNKTYQCLLSSLKGYGSNPSQTDIANYQRSINALLSAANQENVLDVCPSVDNLIVKQNQAQQICDNLEYQDKIKSEKLRLEKNKQYLLKLKQQQDEIDQLNGIIKSLDSKRQQRAQVNDVARVMQYQKQKENAIAIRDAATQRLQSQANNQLYIDLNVNTQ